ncbi:MAG: hypothetical protein JJT85_10435 [Chromatiales bacterium]|nr:hypothetical protein [Chromatiales bacterium]
MLNRENRLRLCAATLCLLPSLAWSGPCDSVLEKAEQAANPEEAEAILGGCLAARGPLSAQVKAAHALLLLAGDDVMACRYAEILSYMLESELPGIAPDTLERIRRDTGRQAELCDH